MKLLKLLIFSFSSPLICFFAPSAYPSAPTSLPSVFMLHVPYHPSLSSAPLFLFLWPPLYLLTHTATPPTVKDRMCIWKRTQIFVFLSLGCLSQYLCIIFLPSHTLSRLHLYCVCSPISPAWPWVPWRQRLFLLCTPRYFQQLCEVALWAMRLQGMYSTWQGESQGATFPV